MESKDMQQFMPILDGTVFTSAEDSLWNPFLPSTYHEFGEVNYFSGHFMMTQEYARDLS